MRGVHRIGKDALTRVKCVGAKSRQRLCGFWFRSWSLFGLFASDFQERKVVDRTLPGYLHILKERIVARHSREQRERQRQYGGVPECGGDYGSLGNAAFDPTVAKGTGLQGALARPRAEEGGN